MATLIQHILSDNHYKECLKIEKYQCDDFKKRSRMISRIKRKNLQFDMIIDLRTNEKVQPPSLEVVQQKRNKIFNVYPENRRRRNQKKNKLKKEVTVSSKKSVEYVKEVFEVPVFNNSNLNEENRTKIELALPHVYKGQYC
eukprot:TRINITY_DN11259_c0_g1_i1.p1 TRINITY_DN11259_c0_g1~~TRINITY_DN11259_c0_g1_i1.p1  ORF type:complete len:141 (+),score=25.72 TRINITY_DN11259_c0_g1_i1:160-582(+)